MTRINLYITDPQHRSLMAIKETSGINVAELIRRAIGYYLEANPNSDGNITAGISSPKLIIGERKS